MAVPEALPLTVGELDAALTSIGGFEPRPLIAVGVSGGPDSLALMILADRWARERSGQAWALIVDHRLRPESAAEAGTASQWLAARSIPRAVLVWDGEKPQTGVQEAARAARYRLLSEWCVARGCLHLLTAHHREDQAETYLIRRRAGSGVDGLAGMSAVRELTGLRLVRPLLSFPKDRLLALLAAEGQPYLRDPSNRDRTFERSRLRMEGETGEIEATLAEVRANAIARIAREHELAALLTRAVSLHPAGLAVLDPHAISSSSELGERALGRVIAVLGGVAYPIRRERLARLREAMSTRTMRVRTLGGCRFVPWRGRVLVLREAARTEPPLSLNPSMSGLWDKRFAAHLAASVTDPVVIGPLGSDGIEALGHGKIGDNLLPRLTFPSLPAFRDEAGLLAVPHLDYRRATAKHLPSLSFRPPVALLSTGFTVV